MDNVRASSFHGSFLVHLDISRHRDREFLGWKDGEEDDDVNVCCVTRTSSVELEINVQLKWEN